MAGFSNPVNNHVLESCAIIFFPLENISYLCVFDRDLCSKVLKEALLLLFFLLEAWNGTKNVREQICSKSNKKCYKGNKNVRNENYFKLSIK